MGARSQAGFTYAVEVDEPLLAYVRDPTTLRPGHGVVPLVGGGQAYAAMLEAIATARQRVCLESYILRADAVGRRFSAALAARARDGLEVYLLYDAVGSVGLDDAYVAELQSAGVHVLAFHPIAPWATRFQLDHVQRRDHRKLLVVDGRVGFTGGINIAREYAPLDEGGGGFHDVHVRVEGPVVQDMEQSFRRMWMRAGGAPFDLRARPRPRFGTAHAMLVANDARRGRARIRRAYLHAIEHARHRVLLENAYFIPDLLIRRALHRAAARGVQVDVVVPSVSDAPAAQWASRRLYQALLRAGVNLHAYPDRMMHAKVAVVDGVWSIVGSYNLDDLSLFQNFEACVVVLDRAFGSALEALCLEDVARSQPIDPERWHERPYHERAVEWACYRARRWL